MFTSTGSSNSSPVTAVAPNSPSSFTKTFDNASDSESISPYSTPTSPSMPLDDCRRPKHLSQWTNADVMKWLKRHCEEYYIKYGHLFLQHEVNGRSLCRITDTMLERMGIDSVEHREQLCQTVKTLKLKSDIVEMRDLERRGIELDSIRMMASQQEVTSPAT
ncbi:Protein aveugle, partial [Fragariocoptes setiger]